jgi:hypothetical protein
MAMYSFVPPFREAKFCGVPSCVFDKLGCAAGEKRLRITGIVTWLRTGQPMLDSWWGRNFSLRHCVRRLGTTGGPFAGGKAAKASS